MSQLFYTNKSVVFQLSCVQVIRGSLQYGTIFSSVVDPDPHRSASIWLSWIPIQEQENWAQLTKKTWIPAF